MRDKFIVFTDGSGRRYRINRGEVDRLLEISEDRLNRGLSGGQPNLVLGCFKDIGYDLERCKKCKFYEGKCEFVLRGFVEKEPLFQENAEGD